MKVIVHTKTHCPWCDMAKDWLTDYGFEFEAIVHDDDDERKEFYEACGQDVWSVPQIFVDGVRIGGYNDLVNSGIEDVLKISFDSDF